MTNWLENLKPGDRVTRLLAGKIPMLMQVTDVQADAGRIVCAAVEGDALFEGNWTFCRKTGGEIDEELGWFPPLTPTGSILQPLPAPTEKDE